MESLLIEELKKEEQSLLARLSTVRDTLAVYTKGRLHAEPEIQSPSLPPGAPPLDGLRIRDAVNVYLNWCRDNGRERITLGELEKAILSYHVTTFRGTPLKDTKFPWKTLTNSLGSPENKDAWVIEKRSDHHQRGDLIGLKTQRRTTA